MPVDDLLKAGIIAYQLEDLPLARSCLSKAVAADPANASAWLWLGRCVTDPQQKRYCYQQAVNLEGDNLTARQALEDLDRQPLTPPPPRSVFTEELYRDEPPQAVEQAAQQESEAAAPRKAAPERTRKPVRLSRGILIGGVGVALVACLAVVVLLVLPGLVNAGLQAATQAVVLPTASQTSEPAASPFPPTWTMTATITRRPSNTPVPTSTQSNMSIEEIRGTLTAMASQPPASGTLPALTPEPPQENGTPTGG